MLVAAVFSLLVLCLKTSCVLSYPRGPPTSVCSTLTPLHYGATPRAGNGGYLITTNLTVNSTGYEYSPGQTYTGKVNLTYQYVATTIAAT